MAIYQKLHERNMQMVERKNRWVNEQLELKFESVKKECTFEPKLARVSRSPSGTNWNTNV